MKRYFLNSKLHNVVVTEANIDYEGSFSIDMQIMEAAQILPNEQIHVYNITNGNRYITYAIPALPGSKTMCANGACAHLTKANDRVIICTYAELEKSEWHSYQPTILLFDKNNNFKVKNERIEIQPEIEYPAFI